MIVDAHEDLAWNMQTFGRDYSRSVNETRRLEAGSATVEHNGESMLGWPDWRRGDVALIFAVLFAVPERMAAGEWDHVRYREPEQAHRRYWSQLDVYDRMQDEHPDAFRRIASRAELHDHLQHWRQGEASERRLGLVTLMEGADCVREPAEMEAWFERGVRIVGPAWDATRYAGSCYQPGGITSAGHELLGVMGQLGMVLDLTHLSQQAALQALDTYPGAIVATHSNVRQLLSHARYPERHLSEVVIERLIDREGVIGVVLCNRFLKDGWEASDCREQVGLEHVVAHVDAICQLAGDADHVGIGSDFDGGFGRNQVPRELNSVADMGKIGKALARRGYGEDDILGILGNNWIRVLDGALPSV